MDKRDINKISKMPVEVEDLKKFFEEYLENPKKEKYGLSWAGKINAKKEALIPTSKTLSPQEDESKDWDDTENVFIEGDNLDALKLLQRKYFEKIKMIYIDPPYNTGKDFIYRDNFSRSSKEELEESGEMVDGKLLTTNAKTNGRFHSDWLNMMYSRLFLAHKLLKDDGVIFISIDDNEVANLRLLMDEIFGEENFISSFMWKRKKEVSNDSKNVAIQGEYVICYAKTDLTKLKMENLSEEYIKSSYNDATSDFPLGKWRPVPLTVSKSLSGGGYTYEIVTPNGNIHKRLWAYPENSFKKLLEDKRIYFGRDNKGIPQRIIYDFESVGKPISNYWDNVTTNKEGKKEIIDLFGDSFFDTPKPTKLIKKMIKASAVNKNDIILDFFAGSGTTAHAVMDLNAERTAEIENTFVCNWMRKLMKNLKQAKRDIKILRKLPEKE